MIDFDSLFVFHFRLVVVLGGARSVLRLLLLPRICWISNKKGTVSVIGVFGIRPAQNDRRGLLYR